MKTRLLFTLTALLISISMFSQNKRNTYPSEWKKTEKYAEQSLPQSAIKEVENILQMSIKEKNIPQTMKAYTCLNDLNNEINADHDFNFLGKLESLLKETESPTDQALIHSILADLYMQLYRNDKWDINERTDLGDDNVPEDIKEWSTSTYLNKIHDHLQAATKNKEALLRDTSKSYDDIIELGADSRVYRPTLYDFVMWQVLSTSKEMYQIGDRDFDLAKLGTTADQLLLPAKEFTSLSITPDKKYFALKYYQEYFKNLQNRGLINSTILLELDKLNYLESISYSFDTDKVLEALYQLEKLYNSNDETAAIINRIVELLPQINNHYDYFKDWRIFEKEETDVNKQIHDWLQKGIDRYPNYKQINILKNRLAQLESPLMEIRDKTLFYSTDTIKLDVIHKNAQLVKKTKTISLFRLENGVEKLIKKYPANYSSASTYNLDTTQLNLGTLPYGKYFLRGDHDNLRDKDHRYEFIVSDLMTYYRNSGDREYEIFVVNRKNGKPVEGATLTIYKTENNKKKTLATLITNEMGLVNFSSPNEKKENYYYYSSGTYTISYGEDKYLNEEDLRGNSYNYDSSSNPTTPNVNTASIFTDRSVYRPGQTVYFKAIVINKDSKVVPNSQQTIKLYNPNYEVVAEKTLITNEFGSVADNFVLPQEGRLGDYKIEISSKNVTITNHYFKVEEYKRPTFEVKFDKIEQTYSFGDKVIIKGNAKTFSGISLQDTDVSYRIARRSFSFWPWYRGNETHFEDGTVKTKDDGTFEIEFTPKAGDEKQWYGRSIYTFTITAEVTDLNGETQSSETSLNVGDVSMILNIEMPNQIEKSKDIKIEIGAKNLNDTDIETSGTYTIYTLDNNDSIQSKILEGEFRTGKQTELADKIKTLTSGKLRIELKGKDDKNREIKSQSDFVLFSYNDKRPPYETDIWLVEKNTTFGVDKPAEIIYGTSNKDAYILYQVYNNQKIFERKFIRLDNENQTFTIPYQSDFKDEIYIALTSVKNGEIETRSVLLKKEEEKKDEKINIKASVFRDKLRPGQEETWTLSIFDAKDNPVSAEVLASMYDISMDKIYPFTAWILNRPHIYKEYLRQIRFEHRGYYNDVYSINLGYNLPLLKTYTFKFDEFKYSLNLFLNNELQTIRAELMANMDQMVDMQPEIDRQRAQLANLQVDSPPDTKASFALAEPRVMKSTVRFVPPVVEEESVMADEGTATGGVTPPAPQIRSNFSETAFFFPQLRTNEKGETVISFTVPESNTTWRFRAFAHDKDSKVGELEKMVITQKELMVTPNMPRFIRQGDKTSISTKISNLSENAVSGEVYIEFFNPIDEKAVNLKVKDIRQKFSLEKDASSSASWTFDVPQDIDLLGVRIVAQSESFSDGEQHALAVLPNRMLVTETMPVDVTEKGEQTFRMDKLVDNKSKTLDNYRLTFEFASNPAWYAIQALPTMNNPTNENALNWFASYYVNTLGASLMKQYPKVENVIKAWLAQGGTKETLVSKLNKNEELKTILLEETPWVLDAKNEAEQMQRLSLLFDLNNTKLQTSAALLKLQELQTPDGGWSWYKGLYPNRSMTQYLLFAFANLQRIGMVEYPQEVKMMQINALKYVDKQIAKDFENLKKYNKEWKSIKSIGTYQLEYLYTRAMYRDIPISKEAREAERFYTDIISKNWTGLNLYEKSLLAVLSKELGNKELAASITKSIREHASTDKEKGMYWANNNNRVFLSMSAVCSHVFLMEALQVNGATDEEMDMMKRWLVKQKQTAVWENTNATIHAIAALLQGGSDWFGTDATAPVIKVGKQTVKPENQELGTGYFKTSWAASEIKSDMGKISITSEDSKPAFGSLYWQYYEDLDKIEKQDGALNVNKELYKEVITDSGKSLVRITENDPLKVGDKVVMRLVVRSDRDMEFVQLKDMRASCFEPVNTRSGIDWQNSVIFYHTTKDASTNFYFDVLPKGTYVFEYAVYVNRTGEYSNGITSVQCAYAPEFTSHTAGIKVKVVE